MGAPRGEVPLKRSTALGGNFVSTGVYRSERRTTFDRLPSSLSRANWEPCGVMTGRTVQVCITRRVESSASIVQAVSTLERGLFAPRGFDGSRELCATPFHGDNSQARNGAISSAGSKLARRGEGLVFFCGLGFGAADDGVGSAIYWVGGLSRWRKALPA